MLTVSVNHTNDRTEVRLAGRIDHESADELKRALSSLRGIVCLDLRDVERITSYGVGLLIRHLSVMSRNHKVEFARCSEAMVDQFQMLQFSNYGRITSFQARYACSQCARIDLVLLEVKNLEVETTTRTVRSPSHTCGCGGLSVVDDSLEFVIDHI